VALTPLTGATTPLGYALLASGRDLYVADSGGSGSAEEYKYTGIGSATNTIAVGGQPIGVAVTPPITKENK
jgi:DNA-binding beta-propeller fold protein YncE